MSGSGCFCGEINRGFLLSFVGDRVKPAAVYKSCGTPAEKVERESLSCNMIQTHKRFKRTLFVRTEHNVRMFGVTPFIKLPNDT